MKYLTNWVKSLKVQTLLDFYELQLRWQTTIVIWRILLGFYELRSKWQTTFTNWRIVLDDDYMSDFETMANTVRHLQLWLTSSYIAFTMAIYIRLSKLWLLKNMVKFLKFRVPLWNQWQILLVICKYDKIRKYYE